MKSSNFISYIGQLFSTNLDIVLQTITASTAYLLVLTHLILGDPTSHWYLPLTGIFLFIFSLTGITVLRLWLSSMGSQHLKTNDSEALDYVRPLMMTEFGKQNMENRHFFQC